MKTKIVAEVIAASTVRNSAKKYGWDPDSGDSPNDFVDADCCTREVAFQTLDEAVKYTIDHINSGDSYWGQEYVSKYEFHPDPYIRGQYQWVRTECWIIDDEGIADHETCESEYD